MFCGVPQSEGLNFSSVQVEEGDLLEESGLRPQKGDHLSVNFLLERQSAIILQVHIQLACEHNTHHG